jgi:hypothetical protein
LQPHVRFWLHKRGKEAQYVLGKALHGVSGAVGQAYLAAAGQGGKEIFFYFFYRPAFVYQYAAFKMKVQAPEIKIGSSYGGDLVVGDKGF